MKKYIIKFGNKYVENFNRGSVVVTDNIKRAGKYSLKIATKHIESKKLNAELIPCF